MHLLLDDSPEILETLRAPLQSAFPVPWIFLLKKDQTIDELAEELMQAGASVVLVDAEMGTYMGMDVVKKLLEKQPNIVCVGFSSSSKYEEEFLNVGAKGFVRKDAHDIPGTIDRLQTVMFRLGRAA